MPDYPSADEMKNLTDKEMYQLTCALIDDPDVDVETSEAVHAEMVRRTRKAAPVSGAGVDYPTREFVNDPERKVEIGAEGDGRYALSIKTGPPGPMQPHTLHVDDETLSALRAELRGLESE